MKKSIIFVIILLFIAGCSETPTGEVVKEVICDKPYVLIGDDCCLDENNNSICDYNETEEKIEEPKEYSIEEIHEDLKKLLKVEYPLKPHDIYPEYLLLGKGAKLAVIETIKDEKDYMITAEDFCRKDCAESWSGWKAFVNETSIKWLFPILDEEDFSSEWDYRKYRQEVEFVNLTTIEKEIQLENGKVLEYQFLPWTYDTFGHFQGAFLDTLLLYKIYCSPNTTIIIKPKWKDIQSRVMGADSDVTLRNWNGQIEPLKEDLLKAANKLLAKCPGKLEEYSFPSYKKSELLSYHPRTDLNYFFNYTADITPKIGVSPRDNSKYLLKSIETTVVNKDFQIYDQLAVEVSVNPDNKGFQDYNDISYLGNFDFDKKKELNIRNKIRGYEDVEFFDSLVVKMQFRLKETQYNIGREILFSIPENPESNTTFTVYKSFPSCCCPDNYCYEMVE